MGNSTITVQNVLDRVAAKSIPIPLSAPSGYGTDLAVAMANDVFADIITERFNWKWNRKVWPVFLTNTYQQDYPQLGVKDIGWVEDADRIDINNTSVPQPLKNLTVRRQLSATNLAWSPVNEICWIYNKDARVGLWPGASVTYYPLHAPQQYQNPLRAIKDANGNILILLNDGTTGATAPVLAANAPEGTVVTDGTLTWAAVDPMSQGFRVSPMPPAAGPVWAIVPYYQMKPPRVPNKPCSIRFPMTTRDFFRKGWKPIVCKPHRIRRTGSGSILRLRGG